ncbi:MAG: chromate transporter [Rhodoferax sp.]
MNSVPADNHPRPQSLTDLFMSFTLLALRGFGGVLTVVQRELVEKKQWLTRDEFVEDWAVAQILPGPNVLFVALVGWNVGLNAGGGLGAGLHGWGSGLLGVAVAMVGIMVPSTTLTFFAARWGHRNRELRAMRAFKQGMAPIVIALLFSTGWVLTAAHNDPARDWPLWLLTVISALVVWKTRIHLLWLLGAGALLGALGLV